MPRRDTASHAAIAVVPDIGFVDSGAGSRVRIWLLPVTERRRCAVEDATGRAAQNETFTSTFGHSAGRIIRVTDRAVYGKDTVPQEAAQHRDVQQPAYCFAGNDFFDLRALPKAKQP